MRVLFLVNPSSGGGIPARMDWQKICRSIPFACRAELSRSREDALLLATQFCQSGGDVLVVAGGDGTVHSVLPALINTSTALALCPLGTSNVLARELGYPLGKKAMQGCLKALQHGAQRQLDVGVANGEPFLLMTGVGLDAHVVRQVTERSKRLWGVYAYIWTGAQQLRRYQPAQYVVQTDQELIEEHAVLWVISNVSRYGWFTTISPSAQPDDGMLDIIWFPALGAWRRRIWRVAIDTFTGRAGKCAYLRRARARTVRLEAVPMQHFQCDGEPTGNTPLTVSILPRSLRVILPSKQSVLRTSAE